MGNFFDPFVFVTESDINDYFGIKSSIVFQKSRSNLDMFNMSYFDAEFSTAQKRNELKLIHILIPESNTTE